MQANTFDWRVATDDLKPPKCFLDSETDIVNWALEPLSPKDRKLFGETEGGGQNGHHKTKHKSLDSSIMELADDISYGVHDLEDGIALGLITQDDWHKWAQNNSYIDKINRTEKLFEDPYGRKEAIGGLINHFISQAATKCNQKFNSPLLKYTVGLPPDEAQLLKALKDFAYEKLINLPNVRLLELKGRKIVIALFEAIALNPQLHLSKDSGNWDEKTLEHKARFICDYIAGMTDVHAIRLYNMIFSPGSGSIFARL
ncbi:MAG: hypothetical protein ACRCTY_08805 [Candidatus Adiutrix sp.]